MSRLSIHDQEADLQVIKELMLKHEWAQVRFAHHSRYYEPYVVLFNEPDEIEKLKAENESLRNDLAELKEALRSKNHGNMYRRDGMP